MAVTVQNYYQFLKQLGDGTLDMDTHTFKAALMSPSFTFTPTNTVWANVSANEISGGNGYTTGGQALTGVTYNQTLGVVTWDFNDFEWLATGGPISNIAHMVIYDDTVAGDPLLFAIDLGGTTTIVDGARAVFQVDALGFYSNAPA